MHACLQLAEGETVRWMNEALEKIWPIFLENFASKILLVPLTSFFDRFKPWSAVWFSFSLIHSSSFNFCHYLANLVGDFGADVQAFFCGLMFVEKNGSSKSLSWEDSTNCDNDPHIGRAC